MLSTRRLLDAGCGLGYGASIFRDAGAAEIVAVDASRSAIQHCNEKWQSANTRFLVHDLSQPMPFDKTSFDMIFSSNAMEYIAEIDPAHHLKGQPKVMLAAKSGEARLPEPRPIFGIAVLPVS
jgi:ubiquinone/menaquinone biosynthesis C-methylase UbiE